jgi:Xaa-Pro aminopeptidase
MWYARSMDETGFDSSFFTGNRERLRSLFTGTAPIVITANGSMQMSMDETYPFFQDRNFWYLTGLDDPSVILVIDKDREYLIVPQREKVHEQFDGVLDLDVMRRRSGIQDVIYAKDGWKRLASRLKKVQHVATLAAGPAYYEYFDMYTNPARANLIKRLKEHNEAIELLDLRTHLQRMRMVKQPVERAAIEQAIAITIDTLKEVTKPRQFAKYAYEYQIEADLARGFRWRGADGVAFPSVVASGQHSCTMHHMTNNGALATGDPLILDVGAQYNHYAADIARTYFIGDKATSRQRQVHQAVIDAQDYAYSLLKPGVVLNEYEKEMEQFIGEKLRELGLIKTIESDAVRHYFPHRVTHFLGLDTHDAGDYDHPLEPGTIIVVEPGIYIPEEGIGVRIEDDVVITSDGVQVLSQKLPRDLL